MSLGRIKTIILHSWYHLRHSVETWADLFYFPLVQLIVFGLVAIFLAKSGSEKEAKTLIMGLILWEVIIIGQYSVSMSAMWEIWSKSFSSFFITPLTLEEFLLANMIAGFFKALLVFLVASMIGIFFYQFSIFHLGMLLPVYFVELLVFSFAMGMFILGLIFRFGTNIQSIAWGLIYIIQPFAAVFYPVSVLPETLRWISYFFPVTYVFESARSQFLTGKVQQPFFVIATVGNIVYFLLSYFFLKRMFAESKRIGSFVRMEG